jgi:PilZ domain
LKSIPGIDSQVASLKARPRGQGVLRVTREKGVSLCLAGCAKLKEQWSLAMGETSELPTQSGQSYPEKRTVPRYSFIAHVEIIEPASDTRIAGRVSEISRKGCYVDVLITLPPGTFIQLKIVRDLGTFSTKGKIIYAQEAMGMGVAFLDMGDDQLKILDAWLAEIAA